MPADPSPPPDDDSRRSPPAPGNAALRAVLAGISIDICGSTLLNIVLSSVYVAQVGSPGMTPTQIDDLRRSMPSDSPLAVLGILLGALISVAAGYVCARIARRGEYIAGSLMAAGIAFVCLLMSDPDRAATSLALLFLASNVACNLLGVKYGAEQNRRLEQLARPPADTSAP
jgi:hypothetical protein